MTDTYGPLTLQLNMVPSGQFYGFFYRQDPIPAGNYQGLWRINPPSQLLLDGGWEQLMNPRVRQPWQVELFFVNVSMNQLKGFNVGDKAECVWQRTQ
jgi:hypothetical protein